MGYRRREIAAGRKFSQELRLEALSQVVPAETVAAVLAAQGVAAERERKLNMVVTVFLVIGMHLFSHLCLGAVLAKLAKGLRSVWWDPEYPVAGDRAISSRRSQVGARPLVALFQQVCRPLATAETRGAFLGGLRLMAIDGTVETAPDTPANAAVFGRQIGPRGARALPQIQAVSLAECGTHASVEAGFWPDQTSERVGGFRMLCSVGPGMLVRWDWGFHDDDLFARTRQRDAQVLARLPDSARPTSVRALPDGSSLASLSPSDDKRRRRGERLLVRIIEDTITDPALPGSGQTHRLITTLVDHRAFPALDLAWASHERWELELVIDETDPHHRLAGRPLRSLTPVGVIHERYGLLIAHSAIRALRPQAALQADLDPDRLSFVHALEVLRDAIPAFHMTAPAHLPALMARRLRDLAARPLPPRRLRSNPRVVKRKLSTFKLKRPHHDHWPQPAAHSFRAALALI
ncbi:MAG: transposase domain-containing protein [Ardenticatenaceae bacterium]|nr:transposase domain-containing protein [Ardenticatenaceae bacterium]